MSKGVEVRVTTPRREPQYDPEALRKGIGQVDKQIEILEQEITKLHKYRAQLKRLLAEATG